MRAPMLTSLRDTHSFMRTTAMTVLITFVMLILEPTVAAAQTSKPVTKHKAATDSDDQRFSQTVQQIEDNLERMHKKIDKHQDNTTERSELKKLHNSLKQLDADERKSFADIEQHLTDHHLPGEIIKRHRDMVTNYQTEYAAMTAEIDAVNTADNDADREARVQKALEHLKAKTHKKRQQPFDPNHLPNQSLQANPKNKPKVTAEQFTQAHYFDSPFPQLAALGDFTFDKLTGANNPAYLAQSDEIKLTPAIQAKAAELNHDPVKIYHWVRNNISWLPSWGGIQDADLTLSAQRGNAMDIASLTIALLRASKIPARYVHGTIDVPSDAFKNWSGGFTSIQAATEYAASGGIPITSIIFGGTINKVRLEHIWVEAAIDFLPSRGAKNKDADSWISLDASYKQYDYKKGLDTVAISGIDLEQLAQNFVASGTVNDSEGWVTGFNPQLLKEAQAQAQQKLQSYIQTQMQNPTVGDVIGGAKTIVQAFPVLPSSLPNPIIVTGARYDKLPTALQQHIRYSFGNDIDGTMINPIDFAFSKVNNAKLTLSFNPATDADEQALKALLPTGTITDLNQLPKSIPSYLIRVIPELKLNGQTVKLGTAMKLGEELPFVTGVNFAGRGEIHSPRTYNVIAGSYLSVNAIAGSVSPNALNQLKTALEHTKTKLESNDQTQIAALTREELLGDLFRTGTLGYYAQLMGLNHIMGLQSGSHYQMGAGTGTFGYEPKVSYLFGIPKAIEPGGAVFDIPLVTITGVNDGDPVKKKQFVLQTGILSSALEHAVPEQMFTNAQNPGEAISAVKALQKASAAGQRIYHITQANQDTTLPNIHHDSDTMTEIRNALNAGKEVITHTDIVSVPGWSGAGYIITDPITGDGAFKIAGGGNGGWFTLLAVASTALLLLTISLSGLLVSIPIFIALVALMILTVSLALIFGVDFQSYKDEIALIGVSLSLVGLLSLLIKGIQFLGVNDIAKIAAASGIIIETLYIFKTWKKQ